MPRQIDAANITASGDEVIRPVLMCDLDYASGHVYAHTGAGAITYGGHDYVGLGNFAKTTTVQETIDSSPAGIALTVSGVDPANISRALGEHYQGRKGILYLSLLDANHQLIGDPTKLFQGRLDTQRMLLGNESSITITTENPLARWNIPKTRRYNNADQQAKWPGDKGFEFVEQSVNRPIYWTG